MGYLQAIQSALETPKAVDASMQEIAQLDADAAKRAADQKMAFASLTSPAPLSSVTPAQVTLAQSFGALKNWTWYGVGAIALFILFRKGLLK